MPLIHVPLHGPEHGIHVQIQTRRPPMHARIRQHHVVNQDLGVRAQSGDEVLEDLLRLVIGPVMEDSAEVVEASAWFRVS